MPEIGAQTGADFAAGENQNVRVRFDGRVELASRNLLSNPDLMDFLPGDVPDGITLSAPESPKAWAVYIRKVGDPNNHFMLQGSFLPIHQDAYVQQGPLADGEEPQDSANNRARIAEPGPPYVEAVDYGIKGLPAGWYGVAYGWIVGKRWGESPYLTAASPITTVQVNAGNSIHVEFGDITPPKGVHGVYLALTSPQSTQNAAARPTKMYIQGRMNVQNGMPVNYTFNRFKRGHAIDPNTNASDCGGGDQWPAVRWHLGRSNIRIHGFKTQLGWRFKTHFGWSKPQTATGIINTHHIKGRRCAIVFRPHKVPDIAVAWQPLYVFSDPDKNTASWYALPPRSLDRPAYLHYTDPKNWPKNADKPVPFDRKVAYNQPDKTGAPSPDTGFDSPTVKGRVTLDAGTYAVRCAYYDSDYRITSPSPPTRVTIAQGQTIKVYRPSLGNLIPNANNDEVNTNGSDDGWTYVPTSGLTLTPDRNRVDVKDTSHATIDEDVAISPWCKFPPAVLNGGRIAIRAVAQVTRYGSGEIGVKVRFRSADHTQSQDVLVERWTPTGTQRHEFRAYAAFATSDANADITIPAWAREACLVFRNFGSTIARDYDYTASSSAFFAGMSVPRRYNQGLPPAQAAEEENDVYPEGGISKLVHYDDAGELHNALSGISLNIIDYWAPYGTETGNDWPVRGYATPVAPDTYYTFSCYAEWFGISNPANLLITAIKNKDGRVLQINPPLIPNAQGKRQTPRRYSITFKTPPGAAYFEIIRGGASDGYLRLYAFQLEAGQSVSAYTNANVTGLTGKNLLSLQQSCAYDGTTSGYSVTGGTLSLTDGMDVPPAVPNAINVATGGTNAGEGLYVSKTGLSPNTAYTGSVFVRGSGDVRIQLRDSTGNAIANGPTTTLTPDWQRLTVTGTTPTSFNGTLQLFVGTSAAQIASVDVAAAQLEIAAAATDWEYGTDGGTDPARPVSDQAYTIVTLDTRPGSSPATAADMVGAVAEWLDGGAVVSLDKDTLYYVYMRSTDSLTNPDWSPWTQDFDAVPRRRYWQVKVVLFSADPTKSPQVDYAGLYIARPYNTLLRLDGTEYPGGVILNGLPAQAFSRIIDEFTPDDNSDYFSARGRWRVDLGGFQLFCFTDEAAEAIVQDCYLPDEDDNATHIIESYPHRVRYRVRLTPPQFTPNRVAGSVFSADVEGARVISQEKFVRRDEGLEDLVDGYTTD